MSKVNRALQDISAINQRANQDDWFNSIHPLAKLFVTVLYLALVVSFEKTQLLQLLSMAIYPALIFIFANFSFRQAVYRMRAVLPLVVFIGIFNPILDRHVAFTWNVFNATFPITNGTISMASLVIKGFLTVFGAYILIASTTVEKILYALRKIHVPQVMVTQIMLTFRYISVLLEQVKQISQSYQLRAPGQKGIHFKVWGSLAGNLLLRSFDRAENLYESMLLRGYNGNFNFAGGQKFRFSDFAFLAITTCTLVAFRLLPVFTIIGNFFGGLMK